MSGLQFFNFLTVQPKARRQKWTFSRPSTMLCRLPWRPMIMLVLFYYRNRVFLNCVISPRFSCIWRGCLFWRRFQSNHRIGGEVWKGSSIQHAVNGARHCWFCYRHGSRGAHSHCRNPVCWLYFPCIWSGMRCIYLPFFDETRVYARKLSLDCQWGSQIQIPLWQSIQRWWPHHSCAMLCSRPRRSLPLPESRGILCSLSWFEGTLHTLPYRVDTVS